MEESTLQPLENGTAAPSKGSRLRLGIGLAVAAVVLILMIGFLLLLLVPAGTGFGELTTEVEPTNRSDVESRAQFKFPPSASKVRAQLISWQDYRIRVRFDLTPSELPAFLKSTGIKQPLSTGAAGTPLGFGASPADAKPWWTPGTPTKFEYGDGDVIAPWNEKVGQQILIDESNTATWTVWFVAFNR